MILRWFLSKTFRQALQMRTHVRRLLKAQRDILSPEAVQALEKALARHSEVLRSAPSHEQLHASMQELEQTVNQNIKPYPNAGMRENIEVMIVAVAVALAIRTFFLEPMKIPSGSMQPTLSGITHQSLMRNSTAKEPGFFQGIYESWVLGISYYHLQAPDNGRLEYVEEPTTVFPFVKKQRYRFAGKWYSVWFPADELFYRAGLASKDGGKEVTSHYFRKGDDMMKLRVTSGDYLFVNRFTYNWRRPQRGEIVIFESRGLDALIPNTHYIKRLVGLENERVQIGNDRHVIVNGDRLDASTPHFEFIYSFNGPPEENEYSGHANNLVASLYGKPHLAKLFPDETTVYPVADESYLVMGDNTMNSFDSRDWGDFPREKVIGKSSFVFWPISSRFGWGYR